MPARISSSVGNCVSLLGGGFGTGRFGVARGGGCGGGGAAFCGFIFCQALKTLAESAALFLLVGAGLGKLAKRSAPPPAVVLRHEAVGFGVRLGGGG
jgi:hypothetical protein